MKHLTAVLIGMLSAAALFAAEADETQRYLAERAQTLETPADLDPLLARVGSARLVLLGEASHGTAEYYTWRAAISQRLITEKGFTFVAIEGDWPSAEHVNRFIRQAPGAAPDALSALAAFRRWPQWMWRNRETADFVNGLAEQNATRPDDQKISFYGIDLYAPHESMERVIDYIRNHAPDLVDDVQSAYRRLLAFGGDFHAYARLTQAGTHQGAAVQSVVDLLSLHHGRLQEQNPAAYLDARQNAHAVKRAEMHFRAMANPHANSWNKRAEHMMATIRRLLEAHGPDAKGVIWAHNTHIGDARATDMAAMGMKNIGWLLREAYGPEQVVSVGFTTHRGTVLAGREWGAPVERMTIPPAQHGSIEDRLNRIGRSPLLLIFDAAAPAGLLARIGHRAKGVVYTPETESRQYVPSVLPRRYDAMIFIAETTALTPLGPARGVR